MRTKPRRPTLRQVCSRFPAQEHAVTQARYTDDWCNEVAMITDSDLLVPLLRNKCVLHAPPGQPFTLASGKTSMHYIDIRRAALDAKGLDLLARVLFDRVQKFGTGVSHVAGVALGGCPLATAVSLESVRALDECRVSMGHPTYSVLYVRKEPKSHGTGKLVEGVHARGDKVVLLEDVVTSGGSSLKAIEALRDAGVDVAGVVAVLDREEGGGEALRAALPFESLVTLRELLNT